MIDKSGGKRGRGHPPIYPDCPETEVYATRLRREDMVRLKAVLKKSSAQILRDGFHALLEVFDQIGGDHATN